MRIIPANITNTTKFKDNNYQVGFNGKIATRKLLIDTNDISSVVSVKDNKTLLNLKEAIKTKLPTAEALEKYYQTLDKIVFNERNHYALGKKFVQDRSGRFCPSTEFVGEEAVAAPNKASLMVENVKEGFWKDYIQDTILLDISYKDFLNVYKKAIAKENCDKVFDLNC